MNSPLIETLVANPVPWNWICHTWLPISTAGFVHRIFHHRSWHNTLITEKLLFHYLAFVISGRCDELCVVLNYVSMLLGQLLLAFSLMSDFACARSCLQHVWQRDILCLKSKKYLSKLYSASKIRGCQLSVNLSSLSMLLRLVLFYFFPMANCTSSWLCKWMWLKYFYWCSYKILIHMTFP